MYNHVKKFRSVVTKIMANPLVMEELSDAAAIASWIECMCTHPTQNPRQTAHREWIRQNKEECCAIVKEIYEARMCSDA